MQWAIGAAVARFPDTEEVTGSIPVSPTRQGNLPHAVRPRPDGTAHADVAQLVEHHLAKVDVASSNLVVRSLTSCTTHMPDFRFRAIGAAVARFPDTEEVTGSIPVSPTLSAALRSCFFVPLRCCTSSSRQNRGQTTKTDRATPRHPLRANVESPHFPWQASPAGLGSNAEERPGSAIEGRCSWD